MSQLDAEQKAQTTITTHGGAVVQGDAQVGGDLAGRDLHKHTHYHASAPAPGQLFHNVPFLPAHFVGRDDLIDELVAQLCRGQTTALSAEGQPGVGKTTLAVALARDPRVWAHFSDGVLWGGLGSTPDVASIQAAWADALGAEITHLIDPYQRRQGLSNAVGARRLLIVLDDAWHLEAAEQLRCSGAGVVHLLTTRHQEIARRFAGATQSRAVPVLAAAPSYALLAQLAPEAYASDPRAAQRLADGVAGLPLALELLGGYLGASSQRRTAQRRQQALTTLADPAARLALATTRLGDARRQRVTLQETITLSLADLPPATVAAFSSLGAFAAKPARFALSAALAVSGADEDALFTLADCNLLEMGDDETLSLHQTIADVARRQTATEATTRHRDHYLALVDEDEEDWQRIETIYPQLVFAWEQVDKADPLTIRFGDSLFTYQRRRGLWPDQLVWLTIGCDYARQQQDTATEARLLNNIGGVYDALGEKQQALVYYEQALPLRRQVGDRRGEATTLNNIGGVYSALGEKQQALVYFEQALPLRRQVGDRSGEATTLNNIGLIYSALGEKQQALVYYEQALPLCRQVGNRSGEATTLTNIGLVYSALGEKQQALVYYEQALPLCRQVGNRSGEAATLNNIGSVYSALGEKQQALVYYEQALSLCRQVGNRWGESITCYNIALVYRARGDLETAERFLSRTVELDEAIGRPDLTSDRALLERVRAERRGTEQS